MTQYPEAVLARELELCYANISLITDYDVGVEGVPPVTHEEVVRVFTENNEKLRDLLFAVIPDAARRADCPCATALERRPVRGRHDAANRSLVRDRAAVQHRGRPGAARRPDPGVRRLIVGREALEEFRVRTIPLGREEGPRPVD